ncbi:hypothetical protein E4K72_10640, partial [Oxalobacteraceae bacterium OM1]
MFSVFRFRRTLVSLAVLTAFASGVHAEDVPLGPVQTWYPVAGSVDYERGNSRNVLVPIRADGAYRLNVTGKGVTVAVMDSGLDTAHREFTEPGKLLRGFNAIDGSSNVTDMVGHGTHVAGLVAAGRDGAGMFGVAFDAALLPIKVLADNGTGSTTYLDRGLRYAIGKASIVNMSLGAANVYNPAALQDAVRAGMLLVVAAGNDRAANPGWPARFAKEGWANGQIIAVGAVDANNRLAAFSNRAGDAAAWFLVAPGINIASTYRNNQYAIMNGTSMAAPIVSGAAALIQQRWPTLRADQIANILFLTATDLGEPGIDPIYGRGLVNVEKAMQPVGTVTTTTYNGRSINVLSGATQLSPATSRLWQLATSGQLRVIGFDDYRRDFNVDLGQTVVRPASLTLAQVFGTLDRRISVAEKVLANGATVAVAYDSGPRSAVGEEHPRLAAFSLLARNGAHEASVGVGGLATQYFGAGGLALDGNPGVGSLEALGNPYLSLLPNATHAAFAEETGGVKWKFGLLDAGVADDLGLYSVALPTSNSALALPRGRAGALEVSKSFGMSAVSVSLTKTSESNSYLGARSNGALTLATYTTT